MNLSIVETFQKLFDIKPNLDTDNPWASTLCG